MIESTEFNSACYYRYANIDLNQLIKNLNGDADLAEATVRAFMLASRDAVPTGKQNSFAAHNPPSLVFAVLRERGAWSLANAFVNPVRPERDAGLVDGSIKALDRYWGELIAMYGLPTGASLAVVAPANAPLEHLEPARKASFASLLNDTLAAIRPALAV